MTSRSLLIGILTFALASVVVQTSSGASPSEADLYRVTLLRAAPGNLSALIDQVKDYKADVDGDLIIMRHSQGDHWDIMLLMPAGDDPLQVREFDSLVSFQVDFLAESDWTWEKVRNASADAGLFHIEMFQAVHGQHDALLKERAMENAYLEATGRNPNAIFVTTFGSDIDSFTIGFYSDMIQFATDPDLSDEVYHKAATDAGFPSRSEIGTYLRQFLVGHNDTLASQIR